MNRDVAAPVILKLRDEAGSIRAELHLRLLGETALSGRHHPLLDLRGVDVSEERGASVQLMEGHEYFFEIHPVDKTLGKITSDKPELFNFNPDGLSGRLRPGLYVGTLATRFFVDGLQLGKTSFEVRSLKLNYRAQYRWMLRDLADSMAEVVMQRFSPTTQRFSPDMSRDSATAYQRFAFLNSLLLDESFQAALQQILHRPYRSWENILEARRPGQGAKGGSTLSRALSKAGPRTRWVGAPSPQLRSLPRRVQTARSESTYDNAPNRVVKFVLQSWRSTVAQLAGILEDNAENMPIERGRAECAALLERLDGYLSRELFRQVGRLTHFPSDSQVLQKRAGYRDVFRAYLQFEVAAQLSWSGGEEVYAAGQRDVAALYEYWVFLELAKIVSELCHLPFDFSALLETDRDRLNLVLKRRNTHVLAGEVERLGRKLGVELYFNPRFSSTSSLGQSWTRVMQPDVSLRLFPRDRFGGYETDVPNHSEDIWLHFDAKYRVENIAQLFGSKLDPGEDKEEVASPVEPAAKRADLLKMHAYRDAIRRSAGAYVIYPGAVNDPVDGLEYHEYHEILPGLGAFGLRPASNSADAPNGKRALIRFIDRALIHLSSRSTRHERGRFWTREAFGQIDPVSATPAALLRAKPPADTIILLGYIKDSAHHAWVLKRGLYNVRADERRGQVRVGSPVLSADLVMLYGPSLAAPELWQIEGAPRVFTRARMGELGYKQPGGELYFCFDLSREVSAEWPEFKGWSVADVQDAWTQLFEHEYIGTPAATSALRLLEPS